MEARIDAQKLQSINPPGTFHQDPSTHTRSAILTLLDFYNHDTGLFNTTNWWNSANCTTVLADFCALDASLNSSILAVFSNTFEKAQAQCPCFLNDFYDDQGWWALAWLRVYDLTHEQKYLEMAVDIFEDMVGGWGGPCGGLWWNKRHEYTGAIENELFLSLAAQLANRASEREHYIQWALRQWEWFRGTGMINQQSNINNGIDATTCSNDGGIVWTYNQGVILGALIELNLVAPDPSYLDTAERIALAALRKLTDQHSILHERGEPNLGEDGPQFKGIFMRNLRALQMVRPKGEVEACIRRNAESIWRCRDMESGRLGVVWDRATTVATAATHSSACDALVAALAVHRDGGG